MKKIISILTIIVLLNSCEQKTVTVEPSSKVPQSQGGTAVDSIAVVNDIKNNEVAELNTYIETDSSGNLIFPLRFKQKGSESTIEYGRKKNEAGYWNLAFFNAKTGEQKLLTENKVIIYNINTSLLSEQQEKSLTKYIFYDVVSEDFNKDGAIADDDAHYLFISEVNGNNFLQISPTGKNVTNWHRVNESDKILITAQDDTDKNGKFDGSDESKVYSFSLQSGTAPQEAFSETFRNKLKVLYTKQWAK